MSLTEDASLVILHYNMVTYSQRLKFSAQNIFLPAKHSQPICVQSISRVMIVRKEYRA